jgi:hypothetical protein
MLTLFGVQLDQVVDLVRETGMVGTERFLHDLQPRLWSFSLARFAEKCTPIFRRGHAQTNLERVTNSFIRTRSSSLLPRAQRVACACLVL